MSWFKDALGLSKPKVNKVDYGEYSQMAKEFFDPNSLRNRGMYNSLRNMGIDSVAQQYLGGMKMQAAGQNPFAQEQFNSAISNNIGQTHNAYNQYMQGAHGIGTGLMGQAMSAQLQNAQAQNAANLIHNQNKQEFWGGLFGNAMSALPRYLFPGPKPNGE